MFLYVGVGVCVHINVSIGARVFVWVCQLVCVRVYMNYRTEQICRDNVQDDFYIIFHFIFVVLHSLIIIQIFKYCIDYSAFSH